MVGFQLPPSGILRTLRLQVPSGVSNNTHECSDTRDDIIYAYVQLILDTIPTSDGNSYKNEQNTDRHTDKHLERKGLRCLDCNRREYSL